MSHVFSSFQSLSHFFQLQVLLSPNSDWLFSASGDIRVWSVPKMLQQMQRGCAIAGITMHKDGSKAVAVSPDHSDGKPNGGLQLSIWETWREGRGSHLAIADEFKNIERFYTAQVRNMPRSQCKIHISATTLVKNTVEIHINLTLPSMRTQLQSPPCRSRYPAVLRMQKQLLNSLSSQYLDRCLAPT